MPVVFFLLLVTVLPTQHPATAALQAQESGAPGTSALDFEYYRTRVEPIFLARRNGNTRCVSCHSKGTPMRLQELLPGTTTWNEEQSRRNFQVVELQVVPRNLTQSRLLVHPLASEGGGTFYHSGGKHWTSFLNEEWQTIANWVCGRRPNEEMVELTGGCGE